VDAHGAAAAQLLRFSTEAFGQADGLTARGQSRLAAAHLNDPVVVFRKDFIQSGGEDVFHAHKDAPSPHKAAISNGAAGVSAA
jgi:hypothetical protein